MAIRTPEQQTAAVREVERLKATMTTVQACKAAGIKDSQYYEWRKRLAGLASSNGKHEAKAEPQKATIIDRLKHIEDDLMSLRGELCAILEQSRSALSRV